MDVILLEKVDNLGDLGERVSVRPGYGRNFLIPTGKATPATADNVAKFEARRAELEAAAAEALQAAQQRQGALSGVAVTISRKAGEEGKLFGSVGTTDIAEAITAAAVEVHKHEVRLPEGPLRHTGDFEIDLHLHTDVNVTITVTVAGEE